MAELFGRERSEISKPVRNLIREGELEPEAVSSNNAHTAAFGKPYECLGYSLSQLPSLPPHVHTAHSTPEPPEVAQRHRQAITLASNDGGGIRPPRADPAASTASDSADMTPDPTSAPRGEVVVYQDPGGEARVDVRLEKDSVWLSLVQIAELFGRDESVISRHLRSVFASGELEREATVAKSATVQQEGVRRVSRAIEYYNLDAILSVG